MRVLNNKGLSALESVLVMFFVMVALALGYIIFGLFNPSCYIAHIEGGNTVGNYKLKKPCKTMAEAGNAIPELMKLMPVGSTVTHVSVYSEGRPWFCK